MRPGVGCDRAGLAPAKRAATQLPDDGEHELATCYAVKGLGLVVIVFAPDTAREPGEDAAKPRTG